MKKLVLALIVGLTVLSAKSAMASEEIVQPETVKTLEALLADSNLGSSFMHQGWVGQAAILRCVTPEGTGNKKHVRYCAIGSLNKEDFREFKVENEMLTASLFDLTSKSKMTSGAINQGWVTQAVLLRCLSPEGTGNPADKKSCELDRIED